MNTEPTLFYKGKPLIRQGRFLFYGDPQDKVILFMNILEVDVVNGMEVAKKVLVQIQSTDNDVSFNDKVIKQCEKPTFYDAFEIGTIWLERELRK